MPKTKSTKPKPINYVNATDSDLYMLIKHAKEEGVREAAQAERSRRALAAETVAKIRVEIATKARDAALLAIAQKELRLETLETRWSDRLDFSDQHVGSLKAALEAAYAAGKASK